jgi:hypothetical protein
MPLDALLTFLEAPFMIIIELLLTIVTIIIYDCNMFIVQATAVACKKLFPAVIVYRNKLECLKLQSLSL